MKHAMNPWDNGFIIRTWDEEDAPEMAELHRNSILATSDEFHTEAQRQSWAHGLDGTGYIESAEKGEKNLVAVNENDKPLGFCGYKNNEICGLYVDPEHQGKGIGQRLAMRAIANMTQGRPQKLVVGSSLPAVSFYEQLGFQIVKKVTHQTRGGEQQEACDMETPSIEYSDQIGPHEGRELELMLAGKKKLAWFNEMDPVDVFEPHVEAGLIHRYVWHDWTKRFYEMMHAEMPANTAWPEPAFYYMPGEEDHLDELLDLIASQLAHEEPGFVLKDEREFGKLLGYSTRSINAYIEQLQAQSAKGELTILDN